jgi:hyperosmotically inducible periplasmic protein
MKTSYARPIGASRAVLAAASALVLCATTTFAADTAPPTSRPTTDRTAATEPRPARIDESKAADNSAQNARDAARDSLTPLDQSHADKDVEMTRSIRQRLVDDDTLGTNAKNVKVITVNGQVTLRGPVENADEQARIVSIAKQAAGVDRVVNELQVTQR